MDYPRTNTPAELGVGRRPILPEITDEQLKITLVGIIGEVYKLPSPPSPKFIQESLETMYKFIKNK